MFGVIEVIEVIEVITLVLITSITSIMCTRKLPGSLDLLIAKPELVPAP